MRIFRIPIIVIFSLAVLGCASKEEKLNKQLTTYFTSAQSQVAALGEHLRTGRVRNAEILQQYAKVVKAKKPELSEIAETLAQDGTTEGPMYRSLKQRLADAEGKIASASRSVDLAANLTEELNAINAAASPTNFDMMLTDPVNVLADMSDGELSRVAAMSKEASRRVNGSTTQGTGSQLIGNPHYGQWRENSSGNSFWSWYGKYAFFSSMFSGPVYYGSWSSGRDYSYFHDVGSRYYSSPTQRIQSRITETRVKKQFQKQGKSFSSPYAKQRFASRSQKAANTRALKKPSKFGGGSNSKFSSPYQQRGNSNTSSNYNSRNSTSSRSFRSGGK